MAKNLKLNIKNAQIAEAINLGSLKSKLAKKKDAEEVSATMQEKTEVKGEIEDTIKEEQPRIKARSRSAFAEPTPTKTTVAEEVFIEEKVEKPTSNLLLEEEAFVKTKTSEELRREIFGTELEETPVPIPQEIPHVIEPPQVVIQEKPAPVAPVVEKKPASVAPKHIKPQPQLRELRPPVARYTPPPNAAPYEKLGPTGRHVKDLLPPPRPPKQKHEAPAANKQSTPPRPPKGMEDDPGKQKKQVQKQTTVPAKDEVDSKGAKTAKFKEFRDVKPAAKKSDASQRFDARDRQGLREADEGQAWRKKRKQKHQIIEDTTIRPTNLKIRLPISIKDLAVEMKLKSAQLIAKLFMQGIVVTLNDLLDDETTVQLLGQEFGCDIQIDTTEEERIRITDKTIREEIMSVDPSLLAPRPPVVAFMGHVDHGKTSLIDAIRKSNRVAGEAGAITQHIGAFRCKTAVGEIAILDTPGHEAFSAMRARGADVTDIVVLVVAGDEGIKPQTLEAIKHAQTANVTIVVAINKCDKPNFNPETVYRQLSENELLPEVWGGQTITINCSAITGEGIPQLLEMLALQSEILELKANPSARARGTVIESEMHKGLGARATVLIQNGTLKRGDPLVFGYSWGRVKTMHDEFGKELETAGPSTPVEITGLSGLPEAGEEFIVVKNEREAKDIAEVRQEGLRQFNLQQPKKISMENLFQQAADAPKKILNLVLRADVQGSLEALKVALEKIKSNKAEINIIYNGVGEISESDVQLAAASKAVILGFHTQTESHAEQFVKQLGVQVKLHDIIYHAVDDVKATLVSLLDKIAVDTERGKMEVRAVFKSSQVGMIAGGQVIEGVIQRNHHLRLKRNNEVVWKGTMTSLKRVKEDVREVQKGFECGVVLNNFNDVQIGDILEAYEVTYITQEL